MMKKFIFLSVSGIALGVSAGVGLSTANTLNFESPLRSVAAVPVPVYYVVPQTLGRTVLDPVTVQASQQEVIYQPIYVPTLTYGNLPAAEDQTQVALDDAQGQGPAGAPAASPVLSAPEPVRLVAATPVPAAPRPATVAPAAPVSPTVQSQLEGVWLLGVFR